MTDADTANRSYPAGVTTRPAAIAAGSHLSAALPGRPPQLRQLSPGERLAAAESDADAEGWVRCHGRVSGCARSVGDLQMTDADTANRSYPAGVNHPPHSTTQAANKRAAPV